MRDALKLIGLLLFVVFLMAFSIYARALELKLYLWLIGR